MKPSIRFEVFKRDAFTCAYCGRRSPEVILEVDHVLAVSQGGRDELDNLVTSCLECNRGKAARPLAPPGAGLQPQERSARIAEHEAQIAEYSHWLAAQRAREDEDLRTVREAYAKAPYAHFIDRKTSYWCWQDPSARIFIRRLGRYEVLDAIEIAIARFQPIHKSYPTMTKAGYASENAHRFWKFFCGICWRKIKTPE